MSLYGSLPSPDVIYGSWLDSKHQLTNCCYREKQQLLCKEKESQLKSFTEKRQGLITMFEEMIAHSAGKLKKEVYKLGISV